MLWAVRHALPAHEYLSGYWNKLVASAQLKPICSVTIRLLRYNTSPTHGTSFAALEDGKANQAVTDADLLTTATELERTLVILNRQDFKRLH